MISNNTDQQWERWGKENPYYGVFSKAKYLNENMNGASKKSFNDSGEEYIRFLLREIKRRFGPDFQIKRSLDFGCGVGRLLFPIARLSENAVGVDISASMLAETRKQATELSINNIELVESDDSLSKVNGTFNFVNSAIVFQHIPVKRGLRIFHRIIDLMEMDGVAALHFIYCVKGTTMGKIKRWMLRNVPFIQNINNWMNGKGFGYPHMQMNNYDLNNLVAILHEKGCSDIALKCLNHSKSYSGVVLFFKKG